MKLSLSVLIPCHNGANWIDRCFTSLTKQGINDFDIIVVDDCSTDNSLELLNKWKTTFPNLKIIKNETTKGAAYSRNVLISNVNTEYFVFIDIDDTLTKNALLKLTKPVIKHNKAFDVVLGKCWCLYANKHNKIYWRWRMACYNNFIRTKYSIFDYLCHNFRSSVWGMLINKKYWDSLNTTFDEQSSVEDVVPSFLLLFNAKTFCAIPHCVYNYTTRSNSLFHITEFSSKRLNDYLNQILNSLEKAETLFSYDDHAFLTALCSKLKYEMFTAKITFSKLINGNAEHMKAYESFKSTIFNAYVVKKYDYLIKSPTWKRYFKSCLFKKTFKKQLKESNLKF